MLSKENIEAKANKISELYPTIDWPDILELVPQIMEVVEAYGIIYELDGPEMKQDAMNILNKVMEKSKCTVGIDKIVPGLIDTIDKASKGKFAINREQDYDKEINEQFDNSN